MKSFIAMLVGVTLAATACSEAADGDTAGGGSDSSMACDPAGSGGRGAGGNGDGASDGGATGEGSTSGAGGSASGLVINELSAVGDDWIELFNAGDGDLDVGGLVVADVDDTGEPKTDGAVVVPAGTTLGAGAYLFILADQDATLPDWQDACDPGPSPCLHGGFGLSGSGDTVFLIGPNGDILASVAYPADATVEGQSWGRLPDGAGDFTVTAPTPGAANAAP